MTRKKEFIYNWDEIPVVVDLAYVAAMFRVSRETVRKLLCDGEIKGFKVGEQWRIRKDDLMAYTMGGG